MLYKIIKFILILFTFATFMLPIAGNIVDLVEGRVDYEVIFYSLLWCVSNGIALLFFIKTFKILITKNWNAVISKLYWIGSLLYGFALLLIASVILGFDSENDNGVRMLIIVTPVFFLSFWVFADTLYIKNKLKKEKELSFDSDSIDEIKGIN